jgi:hypothetical protein
MKTIRDLFIEALSMKARGQRSDDIRQHLINDAHKSGFSKITQNGGLGAFELTFVATGEPISFDGAAWRHVAS